MLGADSIPNTLAATKLKIGPRMHSLWKDASLLNDFRVKFRADSESQGRHGSAYRPLAGASPAEESLSSGSAESGQRLLPTHLRLRQDRLKAWIPP